ncbi:MAG: hypothetical protein L3J67_12350 [Hyphomicrobiaceae bacterium]|nr:hypothetical protein [Hyphomicrobiaceae bacterium]
MITVLALFFALFVFTMTTAGVITAVGTSNMAQYDIAAAALLLKADYVEVFGVPTSVSGPISFIVLAIPAVLSFFTFKAMFTRRKKKK